MNEKTAELYLSFAGIFHRPHPEVVDNLEELTELWREEIPGSMAYTKEIEDYCRKYPNLDDRLNALWEHYIPLFEAGDIEAIPYASVYLSDNGLVLGKEAENVESFYASCGYEICFQRQELPDHLAVELEFLALLARDEKKQLIEEFENRHLKPFLLKILPLVVNSQRPVYSSAAKVLEIWLQNSDRKGDEIG